MIKAHLQQADRPDGKPYISHPANVALNAVQKFGICSTEGIIAAILHDAPEDQSEKITELLDGSDKKDPTPAGALKAIGNVFGQRVQGIISLLTNPDFDKLTQDAINSGDKRDSAVIKNELYKEHFFEILESDKEAFLIKLSDFSENALSINKIPDPIKKEKLKAKYEPVIQELIENITKFTEKSPLSFLKTKYLEELKAFS